MPTPPGILPVGYKWVFVRKRNENNDVVRYKARLVHKVLRKDLALISTKLNLR